MAFPTRLFLSVLFLPLLAICRADSINQVCGKNFSIGSSSNLLQTNINSTFAALLSKTAKIGFAASSFGSGADTIHGLTRCRGDIGNETCLSCLKEAVEKIQTICPNSAQVIIWYELCFIRFDSENFLGQADANNYTQSWRSNTAPDPVEFDQAVVKLIGDVKLAAVTGGSKFGRGMIHDSKSNLPIYGMAQCTRDLDESACGQCLESATTIIFGGCRYCLGCYVMKVSCVLRYDQSDFLFGTDELSPVAYATSSP